MIKNKLKIISIIAASSLAMNSLITTNGITYASEGSTQIISEPKNENNMNSNSEKTVAEDFNKDLLALNQNETTPAGVSISIKEARDLEDNKEAIVSGVVSFNDQNATLHIQDSTGAIAIYNKEKTLFTNIKSGDLVKVEGTTTTYKAKGAPDTFAGLKEIIPSKIEVLENKGIPEPELLTIKELNSGNYDSKYVEIKDAVIDTKAKTLTQGTDVLKINFIPATINVKTGDKVNVKGTMGRSASAAQIFGASCTFTKVDGGGAVEEKLQIKHTPITKAINNSDLKIEAEVSGTDIQSVELNYKTKGTDKLTTVAMNKGEGKKYSYAISKDSLSKDGLEYYIAAKNTKSEAKSDTYSVQVIDSADLGPEIYDLKPAKNSSVGMKALPQIQASIKSYADITAIKVYFDDNDVTDKAIIDKSTTTEGAVKYTPSEEIKDGSHKVKVEVSDIAGHHSVEEWSFKKGKLLHLFGQLHSHTNISDGTGTLDEAYEWVSSHGADYYAVTDHSNWFDNDVSANIADGSASTEWVDAHKTADKWNKEGKFTAIYGYEMTWSGSTGGWGHINTFNTPGFETRTNSKMDLKKYYETITTQPQSISQLNHPGKTFGDFADFGYYSKEADKTVNLVEVGNGEGPIGSSGYFPSYSYYTRALDKGWHVAPTNNQDNHKGAWLTANNARTVILAGENSRDSIYEALREKRVYASEDTNMVIDYTVNDKEMGTELGNVDNLNFAVNVSDNEPIKKVSIIVNGGTEIESKEFDSNNVDWKFNLKPEYSYYYAKVVQKDGDIAVTAPVWVGDSINVGIVGATADVDLTLPNEDVNVKVGVYNNEQTSLDNVKVEYFKNEINEANKLGEVTIPKVETLKTENATYKWKTERSGDYTIYAKVTMNVGGKDKIFTTSAKVKVKDKEDVYKVVIDGAHCNQYISGDYAGKYTILKDLLKDKNAITVVNKEPITDKTLEGVKALVITSPQSTVKTASGLFPSKFEKDEIDAIKKYVQNGGNIIVTTKADYGDGTGEYSKNLQINSVLEAIGTKLRINDDEVIDKTTNGGQVYRLYLNKYNSPIYNLSNGIKDGQDKYSFYSGASVILASGATSENVDFLVNGHETTESLDSDEKKDNTPVEIGKVSVLGAEQLSSGGKVIVSGNTFFSDFEIDGTSGEEYSNLKVTKNIFDWMLPKKEVEKVNISQVRKDENNDGSPDLLGKRFTIEGYVTAQSEAIAPKNAFFEVVYLEDETGGLCVFGISNTKLQVGQKVRITGNVDEYQGEFELQISDEKLDVQILDEPIQYVAPTKLSTKNSMLAINGGKFVQVQGKVTNMNESNLFIDDGSGVARAYVEGYIWDGLNEGAKGKWSSEIKIGDNVSVSGLASKDPEGTRLRVRNTSEIKKIINGKTDDNSGTNSKHKKKKNDTATIVEKLPETNVKDDTKIEDKTNVKDNTKVEDKNNVKENTKWKKNEDGRWSLVKDNGEKAIGWIKDNDNWYNFSNDGLMNTGWFKDNNEKWYYLNDDGAMNTGWFKDYDEWYYLNDDGAMNIGWFKNSDGKWYYFGTSGNMLTNTTVSGYEIDANGVWVS